MLLLYIVSFKEFGSLVCLWHDVKLRKTQLEVRSLTATWSRDLWGHRVVVFLEMCQIVGWTAMANLAALRAAVFSLSAKNLRGGGGVKSTPPAGARVNLDRLHTVYFARHLSNFHNRQNIKHTLCMNGIAAIQLNQHWIWCGASERFAIYGAFYYCVVCSGRLSVDRVVGQSKSTHNHPSITRQ